MQLLKLQPDGRCLVRTAVWQPHLLVSIIHPRLKQELLFSFLELSWSLPCVLWLGWMPSCLWLLWANQLLPGLLHYRSFLMSEFSVSPSDLADELSDCKRIEQDNGPDSPGTHSSIVSDRCLVIIGILSREHWCLNRLQSTAVDREEFYHSKQQKGVFKNKSEWREGL